MRLAAGLFELPIRTAEMNPRDATAPLLPEEDASLARAVPHRKLEFAAGRLCARQVMAQLGYPPAPVLQGADRAPIWPAGLVGSIAHCETWCAVAVGRVADGYSSIGIDIEPAAAISDDLVEAICLPEELAWIETQPSDQRGVLGRLFFSAKECAYKCQYPLTGVVFDFSAIRIHLDRPAGEFIAVFQQDVLSFAAGDELRGRVVVENGHIACGMALKN